MEKINKDMMGASAIPIILSLLKEGDTYGYQIMQRVKELSLERIKWKEGSLYPVLKKLESQKMIKSYWKIEEGKRPRKYYSILAKGEKKLDTEKEKWSLMQSIFDKLWGLEYQTTDTH